MDLSTCQAFLLDLDGVLTPTAAIHMRAWQQMFNEVFSSHGLPADWSDEDYYRHVDGRPRYDGVRAALVSRGIDVPEGTPQDSPEQRTICGFGNRKNELFLDVLHTDGIDPYPGSRRFVDDLVARDVARAVVSSSRNATDVLAAAGLATAFTVVVDGVRAKAEGLAGKPAPDTYLRAAELVDIDPASCAVVEDAVSGVRAAVAGGVGVVIGVDRGVGTDVLRGNGATLVVNDLEELLA